MVSALRWLLIEFSLSPTSLGAATGFALHGLSSPDRSLEILVALSMFAVALVAKMTTPEDHVSFDEYTDRVAARVKQWRNGSYSLTILPPHVTLNLLQF